MLSRLSSQPLATNFLALCTAVSASIPAMIVAVVAFSFTGCEEKPRLYPPADQERAMKIRAVMEPDAETEDADADSDSDSEEEEI